MTVSDKATTILLAITISLPPHGWFVDGICVLVLAAFVLTLRSP